MASEYAMQSGRYSSIKQKIKVIIAEKSNVAAKIACALCSKTVICEDRVECPYEHIDIFVKLKRSRPECAIPELGKDFDCVLKRNVVSGQRPLYFECHPRRCQYSVLHYDALGKAHARSISNKIGFLEEAIESKEQSPKDFDGRENVRYYILWHARDKIAIVDTSGTLLAPRTVTPLEPLIKQGLGVEEIERNIRYYPRKLSWVRSFLFRKILVDELLGEVEDVFIATDYDVAGAYIALSILEKSNRERSFIGKQPFTMSKIKRMKLSELTRDEILNELQSPLEFDMGSAYAGKLRSMVDYLFGSTITKRLNQTIYYMVKDAFDPKINFEEIRRMGVGRVQTPSLSLIVQRDKEAAKNRVDFCIYLVSTAFDTAEELIEHLRSDKAVLFLIEQEVGNYTDGDFLRDMMNNKIGTHTTRFRQIKELLERGLIERSNGRIRCSSLGMQFHQLTGGKLRASEIDFGSIEFNKILHEDMERFKTQLSCLDVTKIEQLYKERLRFYVKNLRELLLSFELEYNKIACSLAPLVVSQKPICEDSNPKTGEPHEEKTHKPTFPLLLLRNEFIPKNSIDEIFNNLGKNIKRPFLVERVFEDEDKPALIEKSRQVFAISRAVDFYVHAWFPIFEENEFYPFLFLYAEDSCAVFKSKLDCNTVEDAMRIFYEFCQDFLSKKKTQAELNERVQDTVLSSEEQALSAHEPLHVTLTTRPGEIKGPDGWKLIEEYNKPWKKIQSMLEGRKYFERIMLFDLEFKVSEFHSSIEPHSFESMLVTMYEKYGWSLEKTERMIEDFYLGLQR